MLALVLAVIGAGTAVQIEELEGIEVSEGVAIADGLARAIGARTASAAAVEPLDASACAPAERCVAEVRARRGVDDVVLLRVFGGPSRVRVIAERFPAVAAPSVSGQVTIERGAPAGDAVAPLAVALYPRVAAPRARRADVAVVAPAEAPVAWAPWVVLGASVAVAAAGVALEASSVAAGDRLDAEVVRGDEADALAARESLHAGLARAAWGAAAIGVGAAVVLWLAD